MDGESSSCLTLIRLADIDRLLGHKRAREEMLALFSRRELDLLDSFNRPKRKREWLGGRLAAKTAVESVLQDKIKGTGTLREYEILPDNEYRPRVTATRRNPMPQVSISHSGDYAVALAQQIHCCGIDIQQRTKRIEKVVSRFATGEEIRLLETCFPAQPRLDMLTMIWTAKEAFKKSLVQQPPGFAHITLYAVDTDRYAHLHLTYEHKRVLPGRVWVILLDGYVLALTTL